MARINHYLKELVGKPTYEITRRIVAYEIQRGFEFKKTGFENLPRESAVLAMNHQTGLDGFLIAANISRQIHYLTQVNGINAHPFLKFLMWAYGEIPVTIPEEERATSKMEEKALEQKRNTAAIRRAGDYLKVSRDYVGIFVDGPSKELRDDKFRVKPLEERSCSESAALIAGGAHRVIVPVGVKVPERITAALWEYNYADRKEKKEFIQAYIQTRGKIPYEIIIGEPIDPQNPSFGRSGEKRRVEITNRVKEEIIRLSQK